MIKNKDIHSAQKRISEKIKLEVSQKGMLESNNIINTLKSHMIFYNLTEEELRNVKNQMFSCFVEEKNQIYRQGDEATCFFILERGLVTLIDSQENIPTKVMLYEGFAENSLLPGNYHKKTAIAEQDSRLWVIDRVTFEKAVEKIMILRYEEQRLNIEKISFFNGLRQEQKNKISTSPIQKIFYKGQTIIKEGDPGSSFYYIKQGSASAYKGGNFIRKIMKGDNFGEQSLLYNTMRQFTIIANEDTIVLLLGRNKFYESVSQNDSTSALKIFIKQCLYNNRLLQNLEEDDINKLISILRIKAYKAGEVIFRQGINGFQKLIIIIEGQLQLKKNGAIAAVKGQCFGQQFMLKCNINKYLEDDIVMGTYGVLAQFSDLGILHQFQIPFFEKNSFTQHEQFFHSAQKERKLQISKIRLKDLMLIQQLAPAEYGPIYLVKSTKLQKQLCIKAYNKKKIGIEGIESFILSQAYLLKQITHPFILNCGKTFQNSEYSFLLSQYIVGEDMIDLINHKHLFTTDQARFYVANILTLLEFLDSRQIALRDLRPENFMVQKNGYLKLINMQFAIKIEKNFRGIFKTHSIVGTPHYIAPQIIIAKGYNNMADLWSLGVMIYELICGVYPFGNDAETVFDIYEDILQSDLKFPQFITDKKAMSFIQQLLTSNPEARLGGTFQQLKRNSWLTKIQWKKIFLKEDLPMIPYKPKKISQKSDNSSINFLAHLNKNKNPQKIKNKSSIWEEFGQII